MKKAKSKTPTENAGNEKLSRACIEANLFLPGAGNPQTFRFASLPRKGDPVAVPDHYSQHYVVDWIEHLPARCDDGHDPNVSVYLSLVKPGRVRFAGRVPRVGVARKSKVARTRALK